MAVAGRNDQTMAKQKIIIDTDPGIDDAMAIFYGFLHPEIDVIGLTTVFGNVPTDIATRNALVLAELGKHGIPIAAGAQNPYVQEHLPFADFVHGAEGFGNMAPRIPKGQPIKETAAEYICRMVNENPGEITLCPIGPLTNIALALDLDPTIAQKTKSVVIMGGAIQRGNVTDYAEANIWHDPHAADAVFAADWDVVMVGLDVTHQVACGTADFARGAAGSPTLGGFLAEATEFYLEFYTERYGKPECHLHDPTAVIAITDPQLFTIENHALEVIVEGERIGQTAIATDSGRRPVRVCMGVDAVAVKELFLSTIESGF